MEPSGRGAARRVPRTVASKGSRGRPAGLADRAGEGPRSQARPSSPLCPFPHLLPTSPWPTPLSHSFITELPPSCPSSLSSRTQKIAKMTQSNWSQNHHLGHGPCSRPGFGEGPDSRLCFHSLLASLTHLLDGVGMERCDNSRACTTGDTVKQEWHPTHPPPAGWAPNKLCNLSNFPLRPGLCQEHEEVSSCPLSVPSQLSHLPPNLPAPGPSSQLTLHHPGLSITRPQQQVKKIKKIKNR